MKKYIIFIVLSIACASASAQISISAGFSPFAFHNINIENSSSTSEKTENSYNNYNYYNSENENELNPKFKYKYKYKTINAYNMSIELNIFNGFGLMLDLQYLRGKLNSMEIEGEEMSFAVPKKDLSAGAFDIYLGGTINRKKRIQFPIYVGVGLGFTNTPDSFSTLELASKVRVKFYLTKNLGIYVGGNARAGFSYDDLKDQFYGKVETWTTYTQLSADAGLVLSF